MSCKLIIRPEAETDMAEQFDWYEGQKKGLGYDFLAEVRSVFQSESRITLWPRTLHDERVNIARDGSPLFSSTIRLYV